MKLSGSFKFLGSESRPSFKDRSQMVYVVGFGQGLDSLRCYVDAEDYGRYSSLVPYSDVDAEFEYNPVTGKINLVSIEC